MVGILVSSAEALDAVASELRARGARVLRVEPARTAVRVREGSCDAVVIEAQGRRMPSGLSEALASAAPTGLLLVGAAEGFSCAGARALSLPPDVSAGALAEVALAMARASRASRSEREDARIGSLLARAYLAGPSESAARLRESFERLVRDPLGTVLIQGPPRSGKRALARELHRASDRASGPLRVVEAASLDDALSDRGAGPLLEELNGGTLVLAEVEGLNALPQAHLARYLERRGSGADLPEVRVVATTSADLAAEVAAGRLRDDLHYRLNVRTLRTTSPQDRPQDRPAFEAGLEVWLRSRLEPDGWVAEGPAQAGSDPVAPPRGGAVARTGSATAGSSASIPSSIWRASAADPVPPPPGAARSLKEVEEALIRRVLLETGGNKLRSAEILGIHRTTLYHKLRDYGIAP